MTAKLRDAWEWICPACGRCNFTRAVSTTLTDDQVRAIVGEPIDDMAGEFVHAPDTVICRGCGKDFDAEIDGD
jgi:uncharacterized cysteine cluster protein YcgN (CxxCxxCC family)